jgi:hypothetical protein
VARRRAPLPAVLTAGSRLRPSGTGTPDLMDTFRHELAIYLNDHLAGATGGVELARRIAHDQHDPDLSGLARDVEQDRDSLLRIMAMLGVRQDHVKVAGGWLGEKLGRLKLNGLTARAEAQRQRLEALRRRAAAALLRPGA